MVKLNSRLQASNDGPITIDSQAQKSLYVVMGEYNRKLYTKLPIKNNLFSQLNSIAYFRINNARHWSQIKIDVLSAADTKKIFINQFLENLDDLNLDEAFKSYYDKGYNKKKPKYWSKLNFLRKKYKYFKDNFAYLDEQHQKDYEGCLQMSQE